MAKPSDWQGRVGQEWADKADALDRLLGPVGDVGIGALGSLTGKRVLDLGCGGGATSLALAALGAEVTGADISQDLIAKAQSRGGDIRYLLGDAAQIDFGGPYDALYSRCGTMFFDNPSKAWQHISTQVGKGCRMSLVCWQPIGVNDWAALPLRYAGYGVESTEGPGPFAWGRIESFEPLLKSAGWDVSVEGVTRMAEIGVGDDPDPVARAVAFCMRIGPLASRLRGTDAAYREGLAAQLYQGLQDHVVDGVVQVQTQAWVITGELA